MTEAEKPTLTIGPSISDQAMCDADPFFAKLKDELGINFGEPYVAWFSGPNDVNDGTITPVEVERRAREMLGDKFGGLTYHPPAPKA